MALLLGYTGQKDYYGGAFDDVGALSKYGSQATPLDTPPPKSGNLTYPLTRNYYGNNSLRIVFLSF